MKLGRTPLSTNPVTVAQATSQFDKLKWYADSGLIDAENFDNYTSGSVYESARIKDVSDAASYSKYFRGQFFDNNSSGKAAALHRAYNSIVAEIVSEDLITSVEYQLTVNKDGIELKTSKPIDFGKVAKRVATFGVTFGLSEIVPLYRKIKAVDEVAKQIESGVDAVRSFLGFGKKRKKQDTKIDYATRETIIIPVPFGFRYANHTVTGGVYSDLALAKAKVILDKIYSGDDIVVFSPQIVFMTKLGAAETYVHQGHIQVVLEKRI